ncbi:MAG: hypothetical protein HKUEN07_14830 [Rhodocyclaceae bacterium]|jgi:hypothetical protein|uniref:AsmA-like C-terminal domain-containing protein n=1 Tax=Candidatus Desulfobacillus denitrificans TaxID=2608985 RepID=A0A809RV21_9PROT|nr:DUF748 domain-containing protein [Rhodocyclaceae bacterium]BBO20257.1 conserved hypothetical protein [Candidatus Desulfobacillus denitrificans]GIK44671.1 MAG: hypothetical protein BroJett012_05740 [Betaproteobacteria bacterium]GJQ54914.1 MAG: hypothetical protein HKUEN07_14830 [Rhodocyclaceae bacterium]
MAEQKSQRWIAIGLAVVAGLAVLVAAGLYFGAKALKGKVEQALGPESEIGEIRLGLSAVEVLKLRVKAPAGWPAPDTLRAERIRIAPDLLALLSGKVGVSSIVVEGGYVSALRSTDGKLRVVPSLLEKKEEKKEPGKGPEVSIGAIELKDGALEFFDATVRKPAHKVRLEQLQAKVTDLHLPDLKAKSRLHLDGVLKGVRSDGKILIDGWMTFASKDSELRNTLRGVDLIALQPYLLKASEGGVRKGTLDLDLQSTIKANHLHAPGTLTLNGLELESGGTFMGMPRAAVVGMMKDKNDRISIKFTLDGKLDDPNFRLNEGFSTRVASSLGDVLGLSVEGLAKGAGAIGQKGVEAAGSAVGGVGKAVKGIFGK